MSRILCQEILHFVVDEVYKLTEINMEYFKKHSMAGTGMIVALLAYVARWQGLDLDEANLTENVVRLMEVVGYIMAIFGQVKRKDLNMGLFRS